MSVAWSPLVDIKVPTKGAEDGEYRYFGLVRECTIAGAIESTDVVGVSHPGTNSRIQIGGRVGARLSDFNIDRAAGFTLELETLFVIRIILPADENMGPPNHLRCRQSGRSVRAFGQC